MNLFRKTKVGSGGGVYRRRVRGRKWQWVAKVSSRGEGSSVRMGDGVSHKLEKQPKAAFAPFLKFFTTFLLLRSDCSAGERSRKRQRERAIFPSPLSPSVIFFYEVAECAYQERVSVSGRRLSDRPVFISRLIAPLHVRWFLPR